MSTSCVRFNKPDVPYDALNSDAKWLNFGVGGSEARFPLNQNNAAGWFRENGYLVNAQQNLNMLFSGLFTIVFWAKCIDRNYVDPLYGVQWVLTLNDGTPLRVQIPSDVVLTDWNHYSIVRDENDLITFRVNGQTIGMATSNKAFALSDSSYMWYGSKYKKMTGDEVILDDILLFDGAVYKEDFDVLPTDYIDVSQFKRFLYIITSTGEVWGYGEDTSINGNNIGTESFAEESGEW